jgi:hypothetical protein
MSRDTHCPHVYGISTIKPPAAHCEECVKTGASWVHLRVCQSCGATLCCDASPNRHARAHSEARSHPVISSGEPGERWLYCYPDDVFTAY